MRKTNEILGDECVTLWGGDTISDTLGGLKFDISPLSFYQVNRNGAERLYSLAGEFAALTGNEAIHFAGSGIAQTCAVWGGGLLAGLIGTKQKRRRPRSGRRKGGDRRKRAVT